MLRCFQGAQVVEDRGPQQGRQSRRQSPCACEDKQLGIIKTRTRAKGHVPRELLDWWRQVVVIGWQNSKYGQPARLVFLVHVIPVVGAVEYCR